MQTTTTGSHRRHFLVPVVLLVALSVLAFARYLSISHGRTFHFDEWYWVLLRNDFSRSTLLENHNGHLSIIPGFIYVVLFRTVGLSRYSIYLSLAFLAHIAVSWALFVIFLKRFGPAVGILIAASTLFLGSGAQNYLWAFQIGFMLSVFGYLLGRIAIDSDEERKGLLLAALIVSLGSSGIGIPATAALALEAILRRWRIRDLWPFFVTGALYLVWYATYGRSDADGKYAHLIPKYARDSAAAVVAGVFDFTLDWGYLVLGILCGLLIFQIFRARGMTPGAAGAFLFLALFWSLTCLSRAQFWDVGAGRYVYAAFIPYLMLISEFVPRTSRKHFAIGAAVLVPIGVIASWSRMDSEALFYRLWGQSVSAELLALELHRESAPWDYFPDKVRAPNIYSEAYFAATDELGSSPAARTTALPKLMREARLEFDRVSLELGDIKTTVQQRDDSTCDGVMTGSDRMRLRLRPGVQYLNAVKNDVVIGFKRFGNSRSETGQVTIPQGSSVRIEVKSDELTRPWVVVQVNTGGGLCRSLNQS